MHVIIRRMRCGSGLLAMLLLVAPCTGATFITVSPGDNGAITYPLQNLPTSSGDIPDVQMKVIAPSFVTISASSFLGPTSVSPNATQNFVVNYAVSANAPAGAFSVQLKFSATSPDLSAFAETVQFVIGTAGSDGSFNIAASTVSINITNSTFLANLGIDLFDSQMRANNSYLV